MQILNIVNRKYINSGILKDLCNIKSIFLMFINRKSVNSIESNPEQSNPLEQYQQEEEFLEVRDTNIETELEQEIKPEESIVVSEENFAWTLTMDLTFGVY